MEAASKPRVKICCIRSVAEAWTAVRHGASALGLVSQMPSGPGVISDEDIAAIQADPLVCKRCGGPLKVVAYITDSVAIRRILGHLGLSPPEKPPPDFREVVRVPVDDEGRQIGANPA